MFCSYITLSHATFYFFCYSQRITYICIFPATTEREKPLTLGWISLIAKLIQTEKNKFPEIVEFIIESPLLLHIQMED